MSLALPAPDALDGLKLSPVHKAAILMMVFGEETAAQILRTLSPAEVQTLGEAMYTVQGIDHDTVDAVLNEFLFAVSNQTGLGIGASTYVRDVLDQALGTHKAQSVLSRIVPTNSERPIEILDWMDPSAVAELIVDEHPQITALVIASLEYAQGAEVLKLLGCISQRAAANVMEEMEAMGPVRLSQVQIAQKEIIGVARRLSDEGKITLAGRGGEKMV
jgi:flagellar motor switch protein FliG